MKREELAWQNVTAARAALTRKMGHSFELTALLQAVDGYRNEGGRAKPTAAIVIWLKDRYRKRQVEAGRRDARDRQAGRDYARFEISCGRLDQLQQQCQLAFDTGGRRDAFDLGVEDILDDLGIALEKHDRF